MTLLITAIAAIVSTIVWYTNEKRGELGLGFLCLTYWGASIMWLADAISEYAAIGAEYFTPAPMEMLNDSFLGISVTAFGLIIWLVSLLIKDPKGLIHRTLQK